MYRPKKTHAGSRSQPYASCQHDPVSRWPGGLCLKRLNKDMKPGLISFPVAFTCSLTTFPCENVPTTKLLVLEKVVLSQSHSQIEKMLHSNVYGDVNVNSGAWLLLI